MFNMFICVYIMQDTHNKELKKFDFFQNSIIILSFWAIFWFFSAVYSRMETFFRNFRVALIVSIHTQPITGEWKTMLKVKGEGSALFYGVFAIPELRLEGEAKIQHQDSYSIEQWLTGYELFTRLSSRRKS